jgi:hypothetical protein
MAGSNYFINYLNATPAIPTLCAGLMDVTITNGALVTVADIRILNPLISRVPGNNVKDYGVVGDGVTDDFAAITRVIARFNAIYFPNGTYNHSGRLLWRKEGLQVSTESRSGVIFNHTGAGVAHSCDGGTLASNAANYRLKFGPARITGNANTTDAFYISNCHEWDIDIIVNNVAGYGFRTKFAIGGRLRFVSTPNGGLGSSPQLLGGIFLEGNTRGFNGQINNGTLGGGTAGTVLTILAMDHTTSAPIEVGMVVTGTGVAANTTVTAFGSGTGFEGTYTVSISQNIGGAGITMSDNGGGTGPTNSVMIEKPVAYSTLTSGIYIADGGGNSVIGGESESNVNYNVRLGVSASQNLISGVYSNGEELDAGVNNTWDNVINGGTLTLAGQGAKVFGGRTTNLNVLNTATLVHIRGLSYTTTFTDSSVNGDIQVSKYDGTLPIGWTAPYPFIAADRIIGKLQNATEERTTTGAFLGTSRALQLNHATVAIVGTWATSTFVAGQFVSVINVAPASVVQHSVKLPSGVTWNGTHNTITLDGSGAYGFFIVVSSTRLQVISSLSIAYSNT